MKDRTTEQRIFTRTTTATIAAVSLAAVLVGTTIGGTPDSGESAQRQGIRARSADSAFDVMEKTIAELQQAMERGSITSTALVDLYMARIEAYDRKGPTLNAMISLNPRAREEASSLDRERAARGARGPLHGIPVVVKDNFDMAGLATTAGSLALAELYPAADAFLIRRLREAGAVILGKTNMHELASGITTISSLGGQTRNPYDLARNPGGSSGGTGAAIAANFAAAGLGTDTCGSIRIPAAHNALVGLRPTIGLSSRAGVLPLSHSQDVAGPLARTVGDLAIVLDATVGADPADEATKAGEGQAPTRYHDALRESGLKGARVGVLNALFGSAPEDNEAGAIVRRALESMKKLGAETIDVEVPGLDQMLSGTSVIDAEFKFDLIDYLARMSNPPVRSLADILDRGLYHSAIETSAKRRNAVAGRETETYRRARIRRETLRRAILAAMEEHRVAALAYPTMRRKAAIIGQAQAGTTCQLSASTGLPALSMPAGFTDDGLPIGIELLGRAFEEPRLLEIAHAFEQATDVRQPPYSTPKLEGGSAPPPIEFTTTIAARPQSSSSLTVRFVFDPSTAELRYQAAAGVRADEVVAAWLHQGAEGDRGAALLQILGRGELRRSGTLSLTPTERAALREGRLYLAFYMRGGAAGRTQLRIK